MVKSTSLGGASWRGWAAGSTLLVALLAVGCGSSTAPTPPPAVTTTTTTTIPPVVIVQKIETLPCPTTALPGLDLSFYREIGCNGFEQPGALQPLRRWTSAPSIYLKTVDEAGAAIDGVTLDTVQNALIEVAPAWTGGRFSIAVTRGSETREGVSGWVTVKWPATVPAVCAQSDVAKDGGVIELNYKVTFCACNGSRMRPRTVRHEFGHALGYWHTDSADDLMSGLAIPTGCDASPSARELAAAAVHYR